MAGFIQDSHKRITTLPSTRGTSDFFYYIDSFRSYKINKFVVKIGSCSRLNYFSGGFAFLKFTSLHCRVGRKVSIVSDRSVGTRGNEVPSCLLFNEFNQGNSDTNLLKTCLFYQKTHL